MPRGVVDIDGIQSTEMQALKNTTLQDPEIPALSMALSGSQ